MPFSYTSQIVSMESKEGKSSMSIFRIAWDGIVALDEVPSHSAGYVLHYKCSSGCSYSRCFGELPQQYRHADVIIATCRGNPTYAFFPKRHQEFIRIGDRWCRGCGNSTTKAITGRMLVCGKSATIEAMVEEANRVYEEVVSSGPIERDISRCFALPTNKEVRDLHTVELARILECNRHPRQKMSTCPCGLHQNFSLRDPAIIDRLNCLPSDHMVLCVAEFLTRSISRYIHNDLGLPGGKADYLPFEERFETSFEIARRESKEEASILFPDEIFLSGFESFYRLTGKEPKVTVGTERYYCVLVPDRMIAIRSGEGSTLHTVYRLPSSSELGKRKLEQLEYSTECESAGCEE